MTVPKEAKAFCVKGSTGMRALGALICVTMIQSKLLSVNKDSRQMTIWYIVTMVLEITP